MPRAVATCKVGDFAISVGNSCPAGASLTARACSEGDKDWAQTCVSFLEAFRRAALLLLCETPRKWRLCAPAAPRSLDHLTSGECRRVA